jgi:hypothetical protein
MSNKILDLSNIETVDLYRELRSRGYNLDLTYSRRDVINILERVNEQRKDDELPEIELDEIEMDDILYYSMNSDYHSRIIDEHIEERISAYIID